MVIVFTLATYPTSISYDIINDILTKNLLIIL